MARPAHTSGAQHLVLLLHVHVAFEFSLRAEHDVNTFSRLFSLPFWSSCKVPLLGGSPSMEDAFILSVPLNALFVLRFKAVTRLVRMLV